MQQLVTYQTASRLNDERDVRAFITKRTCASLILSIGFVTLVLGFLLGKFVTNRQVKLKQLKEPEIIQLIRSIPTLKELADDIPKYVLLISDKNQSNESAAISSYAIATSTTATTTVINHPPQQQEPYFQNENDIHLLMDYNNTDQNKKFWDKLLWCGRDIDYNLNVDFNVFIRNLIDSEYNRLLDCLRELTLRLNELHDLK